MTIQKVQLNNSMKRQQQLVSELSLNSSIKSCPDTCRLSVPPDFELNEYTSCNTRDLEGRPEQGKLLSSNGRHGYTTPLLPKLLPSQSSTQTLAILAAPSSCPASSAATPSITFRQLLYSDQTLATFSPNSGLTFSSLATVDLTSIMCCELMLQPSMGNSSNITDAHLRPWGETSYQSTSRETSLGRGKCLKSSGQAYRKKGELSEIGESDGEEEGIEEALQIFKQWSRLDIINAYTKIDNSRKIYAVSPIKYS
ncbi:hypothetical protein C7212DRAFT_348192 [Tuber magnatum]|uniref:Uncharacterized protein n=1 Tax=Tuber magnatum TaxID=42249 RepID=A0A317SDA1_9PEZI|nr:hypothetical protein C7212DRAFT_348192 [Tuber magnatum]